jgi:hypothetical protein
MALWRATTKTTLLLQQLTLLLLFSAIGSLLLTSCKKEEPYYALPPEGLSYIQLRPGQYFIYKDSASGTVDSVIVTESKLEKVHSDGSGQFRYSAYFDNYSLTLTKYTTASSTVWLKGIATAAFSSSEFTLLSSLTNDDWDIRMLRYPAGYLQGIFSNDRLIPVLVVAGKQYTQVILTAGNSSNDSKFYWAKGVGLVRYERGGPAPQTFTLLRNN